MVKKSLFYLFFIVLIFLGKHTQANLDPLPFEEKILSLFPDKFTQKELDKLRDQQPVFHGDLVYSMDNVNALKLNENYPLTVQFISKYGFAHRVKKMPQFQIDSNYSAQALYQVESAYSKHCDNADGFYVNVERIIDTYSSILNKNLDQNNETSLISINNLNDEYIYYALHNDYNLLINKLAKFVILLNTLDGRIFSGTFDEIIQSGKELLSAYIAQKFKKRVDFNKDNKLSIEDMVSISETLKHAIFEKIGIDPLSIPNIAPVEQYLNEKNWLAALNEILLQERYENNDPSLIKINILSNIEPIEKKLKILSLFPEHFTQEELDLLKDKKQVHKDDLVYSMDPENAEKLWSNYPTMFQVISKKGFPQRVIKSGTVLIESDYTAYANYIVQSAYLHNFDDNVGFNIKIERIIDNVNAKLLQDAKDEIEEIICDSNLSNEQEENQKESHPNEPVEYIDIQPNPIEIHEPKNEDIIIEKPKKEEVLEPKNEKIVIEESNPILDIQEEDINNRKLNPENPADLKIIEAIRETKNYSRMKVAELKHIRSQIQGRLNRNRPSFIIINDKKSSDTIDKGKAEMYQIDSIRIKYINKYLEDATKK